jgi:hypothetical protein
MECLTNCLQFWLSSSVAVSLIQLVAIVSLLPPLFTVGMHSHLLFHSAGIQINIFDFRPDFVAAVYCDSNFKSLLGWKAD